MAGGLWSESEKLYPLLGAIPKKSRSEWIFPSGATVSFRHLQHESTKFDYQGAQIPLIEFDEITHFTEDQFFYLLSRNRSTSGIPGYVRGTCNPDPHSWVKRLCAPWLDSTFENPAASGELRWWVRDGGLITWVPEGTPDAKSLTFIRSSIYDNPILLAKDPAYLSTLKSLPAIERERLLNGNWDALSDGVLFQRENFPIVDAVPYNVRMVRYWDLAATELKPGGNSDPDWTVGVLLGRAPDGSMYVLDVQRLRGTPQQVEALIKRTAEQDGTRIPIYMEEEGGSSGKVATDHYTRQVLHGYQFRAIRSTGSKVTRAQPVSSFAERANIQLVRAAWNNDLVNELVAFPNPKVHDDQVDALSGAFAQLCAPREIEFF